MDNIPNIENLNNIVVWKKKEYHLIDISAQTGGLLFNPVQYGFDTRAISKECKSGYYCMYQVDDAILYMAQLNIMTADGLRAPLDGVEPVFCQDDHTMEYRSLHHLIQFSGVIRIGRGMRINAFKWLNSLGPGHLRELWDLEFHNGTLIGSKNRKKLAEKQISVQEKIFEYLTYNNPGLVRTKQLLEFCAYHNQEGWTEKPFCHPGQDMFSATYALLVRLFKKRNNTDFLRLYDSDKDSDPVPYFHALQPQASLLALKMLKKLEGTPDWFIARYGDSGLSQRLTFEYLKELGVPSRMRNYLKQFVSADLTVRKVILEFLESMHLSIAKERWEERVLPGYLYTDANIPQHVTSAIRNRISVVTLDNWGWMKGVHFDNTSHQ